MVRQGKNSRQRSERPVLTKGAQKYLKSQTVNQSHTSRAEFLSRKVTKDDHGQGGKGPFFMPGCRPHTGCGGSLKC